MDGKNLKANNTTDTMRRKQALVTITPYNEQQKRMLNETTTPTTTTAATAAAAAAGAAGAAAAARSAAATGTAAAAAAAVTGPPVPPPAPPLPFPSKNRNSDDSVEMQSIESFKLKETPNTVPKPPPTYFPVTSPSSTSGSPIRHIGTASKVPKDAATSPVAELAKSTTAPVSPINGAQASKVPGGKVAIRIGSYEGETKQPSRLEFLPQQPSRDKNGPVDESDNAPVVSRLQNELAATLQRSNLRRKTEGENQSPVKTIHENAATSSNETTNPEPNKLLQSNIEKLASALSNKVTIKVNPENSSR